MKYAPVNTAYRPDTETVEQLYVIDDDLIPERHTKRLSEAIIFDTLEEVHNWINDAGDFYKVVEVTEKQIFEAKLKNE